MRIRMHMVKVISLSEEAYGKLKAVKRDRSFSEVVVNLVERTPRRDIMEFAGIWKDKPEAVAKMKALIAEDRKRFKLREVRF